MDFSFIKNLFSTSASNKEDKTAEKTEEPAPILATETAEDENGERKTASRRHRGNRHQREDRTARDDHRTGRRFPNNHSRRTRPENPPASDDALDTTPVEPPTPEEEAALLDNLKEFTLFVAKQLVTEPEQVTAELLQKDNGNVIMLACEKKDTGKLIGKNGKIIASIRILVSGAAGKAGVRATVDIQD